MRGRILRGRTVALGVTLLAATAALGTQQQVGAREAPAQPNVLLILVDDQTTQTFKPGFMPHVFGDIVNPGTRFTNGLAAPPLCCPDRAGVLTGQYAHDNGVFGNHPGYPDLTDKTNTLPVWLRRAGYRTGFIGKFLNGFDQGKARGVAPGFDTWFELHGAKEYNDFDVSTGGSIKHFGTSPHDYSTDAFTRRARQFIGGNSAKPFFLWLAYNAPHDARSDSGPCAGDFPQPRTRDDYQTYRHASFGKTAAFDERDVGDKPAWISRRPRLAPKDLKRISFRYRCTLATVARLDHDVGALIAHLKADGELDNTIVLYLSDNGLMSGQHRIVQGKEYPYEPDLQVPFAIRVPAAYRTSEQAPTESGVVSNVDVAATLLDFAGAAPSCAEPGHCRVLDGRSMSPLLGGSEAWPADRAAIAEITGVRTKYEAIRAEHSVYVDYGSGQHELYDLQADPFELHNLAGEPSAAGLESDLKSRLQTLEHCAGIEGRDPQQGSRPFCE